MPPDPHGPMSVNGANAEGRKLGSWKEIAEYIGRDVRTAIRWEKQGLPVRTVPGLKRRSVFAYTNEIDAWLAHSTPAPETDGADPNQPAAQGEASEPKRFALLRRRWVWVAAALASVLIPSAYFYNSYFRSDAAGPVESFRAEANTLLALNRSGSVVWRHRFSAPGIRLVGFRVVPSSDISGASIPNFLLTISLGDDPRSDGGNLNAEKVYLFTSRGQLLWEFANTEQLRFAGGEFGPMWGVRATYVSSNSPESRILVATQHYTWWPSILFMLDANGRTLGRFVNAGWITGLKSIENSTGTYALAAGVSNAYDAGILTVIDVKTFSGSAPVESGTPYECWNCPPGKPVKYFVFPRSELNRALHAPINFSGVEVRSSGIEVHTTEAPVTEVGASAIYEFTHDFQLARASYEDRYWELHRRLESEGKIKHTRENCPDRFGPRGARVWTPSDGWRDLPPSAKN